MEIFINHYDIQKCQNIQDLARFLLNGEIVEGQMCYKDHRDRSRLSHGQKISNL